MAQFDLDFLPDYSDEALLEEIQRVAGLAESPALTQADFSRHGKVCVSTVKRRFGGWEQALCAAGLGHRYSGRAVSEHMRRNDTRLLSDADILALIRLVASKHSSFVTTEQLSAETGISHRTLVRRFGSWANALERAGVLMPKHAKRFSDTLCFENLYSVWLHYGRQPYYDEMSNEPSEIGPGTYTSRWGTWRKALVAFVEWANSDGSTAEVTNDAAESAANSETANQTRQEQPLTQADRREIPLGLRFRVLVRDSFRCVACGRSPAITLGVELQVDHIVPFNPVPGAPKGKTVVENLQTLCKECNLGKGNKQF